MPTNLSNSISRAANIVREAVVQPVVDTAKVSAPEVIEQVTGIQSSSGTQQQNPNQSNTPDKDPIAEKQLNEQKKANIINFIEQFKKDKQHLDQQNHQQEQLKKQTEQQEEEKTQIKQYEVQKKQQNIAVKQAQTKSERKGGRG
jgi:hypothetical protein